MHFRAPVKFSACESDYLKANLSEDTMQLAAYLSKSVSAIKKKLREIKTGIVPQAKGKRTSKGTKIGKRPDLGITCRSGWEANFLRYLKHHGFKYEYEPDTFLFTPHGIKHGTVSYTPDIKVYRHDGTWFYVEIKGYLDSKDKTKINRFKKYYPNEAARLVAVVGSATNKTGLFFKRINVPIYAEYNLLNKEYKDKISNWE